MSEMTTPLSMEELNTITWMQTGSNQQLDFAADEWIVLPIELIARSLANTCRYNGQCSRFYSVAEHSVLISRMVPEELALAALLHDASEVYVGDMPPMLKRHLSRTGIDFKGIERKASEAVARGYGLTMEELESPVIKRFDKRILADETMILMPPHDYWSHYMREYEPTGVAIACWPPDVANQMFLERFAELTVGGDSLPSECRNLVKFHPESKEKILSGSKFQTARKGRRFFFVGQVLDAMVNETGEVFAKLRVESVTPTTLEQFTDRDAQANGYTNKADFWAGYQKSFPATSPSEPFTLVTFQQVQ